MVRGSLWLLSVRMLLAVLCIWKNTGQNVILIVKSLMHHFFCYILWEFKESSMLVLYKMICVINSNIQIRCYLVDKTLTDLFRAMLQNHFTRVVIKRKKTMKWTDNNSHSAEYLEYSSQQGVQDTATLKKEMSCQMGYFKERVLTSIMLL